MALRLRYIITLVATLALCSLEPANAGGQPSRKQTDPSISVSIRSGKFTVIIENKSAAIVCLDYSFRTSARIRAIISGKEIPMINKIDPSMRRGCDSLKAGEKRSVSYDLSLIYENPLPQGSSICYTLPWFLGFKEGAAPLRHLTKCMNI